MKNIIAMVIMIIIFISGFFIVTIYNEKQEKQKFTIENLNYEIDNSMLNSQLKFNTYNENFIGDHNYYIYSVLKTEIQSFLIKTYFYHFKDKMSFYDFIFEFGYSSYYLLSEKR